MERLITEPTDIIENTISIRSETLEADLLLKYKKSYNRSIIIHCPRTHVFMLASFLKLHTLFLMDNPIDISVVDQPQYNFRYAIHYQLQSSLINSRVIIIVKTSNLLDVISLTRLYPAFA
jgi:NADH:ubiquinone oxidoreductase subunit C